MSGGVATAGPGVATSPPPARRGWRGWWRDHKVTVAFLAPAAILLGVWIVYPTIYTIVRSLFDREGSNFVGLDNYGELFSQDILTTAIKNNALWLAIVPAFVTAIGLVFAVLLERIRWSTAFKTVVFMPMAISLFAAGVIWRVMDEKDPEIGAVNASINVVADAVDPPGALPDAQPSTRDLSGSPSRGIVLELPLRAGDVARLGLTAIPPKDLPQDARQARAPPPAAGAITGVVWRDFRPGGGRPGVVERGELGIPGVIVELRDLDGKTVEKTESTPDGVFAFRDVGGGEHRVAIGPDTFAKPFEGVSWLGEDLITPAVMLAYIWVWAGFAMVVTGAGLAAIPRDLLEAARTDGASEWQVFRRVTVPLLRPVLVVVFVTMLINVLKVFDIVLSVAPASSQDDANVIALAMWRTAFGGVNDFGLGSAIAVFLFLLVIPILLLNIRNFRRET
jgi:alpha-glucoside transport system permease protein